MTDPERGIRVVLADGQKLALLGMRQVLAAEADIEITAQVADGEEAVRQALELEPDVLIVDARLPRLSGVKVTQRVKRELPNTAVIVLSDVEEEQVLLEATKAGASAYLTKDCDPAELVETIRRVRSGQFTINEKVFSRPAVASKVLQEFRQLSVYGPGSANVFAPLSPREVQILDNIAQGRTNKEVAYALAISEQTVKNHMSSILRKLSVNDRTQAVVYAMRQGWIRGPDGS